MDGRDGGTPGGGAKLGTELGDRGEDTDGATLCAASASAARRSCKVLVDPGSGS